MHIGMNIKKKQTKWIYKVYTSSFVLALTKSYTCMNEYEQETHNQNEYIVYT